MHITLDNLRISKDYFKYEIIADASARHRIDNRVEFERLVKNGKIVLSPAGIEADDLIWMRARSLYEMGYEVSIISNDMFPLRRSEEENIPILSVTVSRFNDGRIYFLTRRHKAPFQAKHKPMNTEICFVGINAQLSLPA